MVTRVEKEGERRVTWRRTADRRSFDVLAWQLRLLESAESVQPADHAEDPDELPWQIVAMMDPKRLEELLEEQRAWNDQMHASRRRGGGKLVVAQGSEVRGLLGASKEDATSTQDATCEDTADRAWLLCEDGRFDEAEEVLLAAADAPALVARAFCARCVSSDPRSLLAALATSNWRSSTRRRRCKWSLL